MKTETEKLDKTCCNSYIL